MPAPVTVYLAGLRWPHEDWQPVGVYTTEEGAIAAAQAAERLEPNSGVEATVVGPLELDASPTLKAPTAWGSA